MGIVRKLQQGPGAVKPERDAIARRYRYRRLEADVLYCVYCGMAANVMDHRPPLKAARRLELEGVEFTPVIVPACYECNDKLGARPIPSVAGARAFIADWLRGRLRAAAIASWSEDEIAELGPNCQHEVRAHLASLANLRDRIAHASDGAAPRTPAIDAEPDEPEFWWGKPKLRPLWRMRRRSA